MTRTPEPSLQSNLLLSISVIIPTLNEASTIGGLLKDLGEQGFGQVIVADGGSRDSTVELADAAGVVALRSAAGRALQMNTGASAASGEVLIFLHADTRLPSGATEAISLVLRDPRVVGGCFRLRFEPSRPVLRLYGLASWVESYWTSFGDQAFFMRRSAFAAVGGFPQQPLMEDVEMRRHLKRVGRFVKLPSAVMTSARRFEKDGLLRRQALNGMMLTAYGLGISAERLKRFYA